MKNAIQREQDKTLGEFSFKCPHCGKTVERSLWSIAHFSEPQAFSCDCGKQIGLAPGK